MVHPTTLRESLLTGRALGLRYRLALPRAALRGRNGVRLGVQAGSSLDFHDYRDYHPGDDLRHLDWSVYARSDKEVVRLFREEVAPHVDLVLDISRSMRLEGTAKAAAAVTLAAACAAAADNAHCSHTVWLAGERVDELIGSRHDPAVWQEPNFDTAASPDAALLNAPPAWRRHGVRVLISDLLWPTEPAAVLRRLADGAAALTVIQLLTREEETPDWRGPHRLEDVETGGRADLLVDATACAAYVAALARLRDGWSTACRGCGAAFAPVTAERMAEGGRLAALETCGLLEAV
ncbi:MAG: DUF58 domain-containing protein [Lentisphaerota bacterium]